MSGNTVANSTAKLGASAAIKPVGEQNTQKEPSTLATVNDSSRSTDEAGDVEVSQTGRVARRTYADVTGTNEASQNLATQGYLRKKGTPHGRPTQVYVPGFSNPNGARADGSGLIDQQIAAGATPGQLAFNNSGAAFGGGANLLGNLFSQGFGSGYDSDNNKKNRNSTTPSTSDNSDSSENNTSKAKTIRDGYPTGLKEQISYLKDKFPKLKDDEIKELQTKLEGASDTEQLETIEKYLAKPSKPNREHASLTPTSQGVGENLNQFTNGVVIS